MPIDTFRHSRAAAEILTDAYVFHISSKSRPENGFQDDLRAQSPPLTCARSRIQPTIQNVCGSDRSTRVSVALLPFGREERRSQGRCWVVRRPYPVNMLGPAANSDLVARVHFRKLNSVESF